MAVLEGDGGGGSAAAAAAARKKAAREKAARERARRRAAAQAAAKAAAAAAKKAARERRIAAEKKRQAQIAARQRFQAEQKRINALTLAKKQAAAIASAAARKAAFELVKKRQSEILRQQKIIKDKRVTAMESPSLVRQKAQAEAIAKAGRAAASVAAAQYAAIAEANRKRAKQRAIATGKGVSPGGIAYDNNYDDDARMRDLEKLIREEAARSKDGRADYAFVERAGGLYSRLAESVYEELKDRIVKVKALNAKLTPKSSEAQWNAARKAYDEYLKTHKRFTALYGDGRDTEREGSYTEFFKNTQAIALGQREWWKKQMRSNFELTLANHAAGRYEGSVDVNEAKASLALLDGKIQTGMVRDADGDWRRRTIEEELEHRQALVMMRREKIQAALEKDRVRAQWKLDRLGMTYDANGRPITLDQWSVDKRAERVMNQFYGGESPVLTRPQDLQEFADRIVRDWEISHPRPAATPARGSDPAFIAWKTARDAFERHVYARFGSDVPGLLERGMTIPGIRDAMAILMGANAAIGTVGRLANEKLTGRSVVDSTPDWSELPTDVKKKLGLDGPLAGILDVGTSLGGIGFGGGKNLADVGKMNTLKRWLVTPEGQKWWAERQARLDERNRFELPAFLKAFEEGDAGGKLDALNAFGSRPSASETDNLVFQLLADPTNAVPLKFTTYLARAKYARDAYGASNKGAKAKLRAVNTFRSVDEGILRAEKELAKVKGLLAKSGMTKDQLVHSIREELVGVAPDAQRAAYDRRMKKLGLDRADLNNTLIFNQIRHSLQTRVVDELGEENLFTQSQKVAKEVEEFEKARKAAERVRVRERVSESSRVNMGDEKTLSKGKEAAERLEVQRRETTAAVEKRVATEKAKPAEAVVAEGKPLGKASPPAKTRAKKKKVAEEQKVESLVDGPIPQNRVRAGLSAKIAAKVDASPSKSRVRKRSYEGWSEYYIQDALGNRLPKDTKVLNNPKYKQLVKRAKAGDKLAQEQLESAARFERNRARRLLEDERSVKTSKFTPSEFDFFERAGVLGDKAAQESLRAARSMVRQIRLRIGRGTISEGKANSIRQLTARIAPPPKAPPSPRRHPATGKPNPVKRSGELPATVRDPLGDARSVSRIEYEFDAIDNIRGGDRLDIGADILEAREKSLRGARDVYAQFTGYSMQYYHEAPGIWQKMKDAQYVLKMDDREFVTIFGMLETGRFGEGVAGFRDGGQLLFEIFHRLRRDEQWAKLGDFNRYVDAYLDEYPDSLFGWQWKVMWDRAALPGAGDWRTLEIGFKDAAVAWGIHPDLSLAAIPSGYYAQRPPLSFGLRPRLQGMLDSRKKVFSAAPHDWTEKEVRKRITYLFREGRGEASPIVHYVAERFGDFTKATPVWNRIMDETALQAALSLGVDELAHLLGTKYAGSIASDAKAIARNRKDPLSTPIASVLHDAVARFGPNPSKAPERVFPKSSAPGERLLDLTPLREAVEAAYWQGDLPLANQKVHTLMYLGRLQSSLSNGAFVAVGRQYVKYMEAIGPAARNEAKEVIGSIHFDRIERLANMVVREARKSFSKEVFGAEAEFYLELGLMPNQHKIRAIAGRIAQAAKAQQNEADLIKKREEWIRGDEPPMDAYTGTQNVSDVHDRLLNAVDEYKRTKDKRWYVQAENELFSLVDRVVDTGASRMSQLDFEELASIADDLVELPSMLKRLEKHIGDRLLEGRKTASHEVLAYQDAILTLRLRALETRIGTLPGRMNASLTREIREVQKKLLEVRETAAGSSAARRVAQTAETQAHGRILSKPAQLREKILGAGASERAALEEELVEAEAAADALRAELLEKRLPRQMTEERTAYLAEAELTDTPPAPHPETPVEAMPTTASEILLNDLLKMTEEQWWERARVAALSQIKSGRTSAETKAKARQVLNDIAAVKLAKRIEAERKTPRATGPRRKAWVRRVDRAVGKMAEDLISPKMIGPYARDIAGSVVEQARTYYVLLQTAAPGPVLSSVRGLGPGKPLDHFPKQLFDEVEQEVAAAIREFRGWTANTRTKGRGAGKMDESEAKVARMSDSDPNIVAIKQRVLAKHGISLDAYDEARAVLWKGYVQDRTVKWLQRRADDIVARTGADWDETFLKLRAKEAKREAHRQLASLSAGEMFGFEPDIILSHFIARYTDDGTIRHYSPELSVFQRRTLEEHVKHLTGGDVNDSAHMSVFFKSQNWPPFDLGREAVRDWLVKHGAWSPRTAEQFVLGKKTWSIYEEADYWRSHFAYVPEWTDPKVLAEGMGPYNLSIFSDPEFRYLKYKEWGMFGKSVELKHRLDGVAAQRLAEAHLKGDDELAITEIRELELQRKYAVERYGDLVGHRTSDGGYVLHEMPDLMTPTELSSWRARRATDQIPPGIIKDAAEQEYVTALISSTIDKHWSKFEAKVAGGEQITHQDIAVLSAEIQKVVLSDPKFAHRGVNKLGRGLEAWTAFSRWQVFSNPAFLVLNAVDVPIKTGLYRYINSGLFNPSLSGWSEDIVARAKSLTLEHLGENLKSTLYDFREVKAVDYMTSTHPRYKWAKKVGRILSATEGVARAIPEYAGRAELGGKLWLARSMYPEVYTRAFRQLGNEDLADAFAKRFIKQEIKRMWPTAGDGPIEQLWNRFAPFSSYQVRNKLLFIREGLNHPELLVKMERIGAAIERVNREQWAEEHPNEEFPRKMARRIQLPWAPGYFIDLSNFSDAARGLKPLYGQDGTTQEVLSSWLRVINPGTQSFLLMFTNAMGLTQVVRWRPILDANGFPTGEYERVVTGWTEPWSDEQPGIDSVFWLAEAVTSGLEFSKDDWTSGEVSQMLGQVFTFGAIETYDKGAAYMSYYQTLKKKDRAAAEAWLEGSKEGQYLALWMKAKQEALRPFFNPYKAGVGSTDWYFQQTPQVRAELAAAYAEIKRIKAVFGAKLASMTKGTVEYRTLRAEMWARVNGVYLDHPVLMEQEVYSKSPSEWAADMADWQVDRLTDAFFALSAAKPSRADFDSQKDYNDAVTLWEMNKSLYLASFPQVRDQIADARAEVQSVKDKVEAEWNRILGDISERKEAIETLDAIIEKKGYAATGAEQLRRDMLYLANELDYSLLEKDNAATFFSYEDFQQLPRGVQGPLPFVQSGLIKQVALILDFDSVRYNKAKREGKELEFLKQQKYGEEMRKAVLAAKGGDPYGKFDPVKWSEYLKGNSNFRQKWFDENPGKQAEWEENESYIRHISVWGKLVGREAWDAAGRAWDALPLWVRQRYLGTHPDAKINLRGDFIGGGSAVYYKGQWFKSAATRDRFIAGGKAVQYNGQWFKSAASRDRFIAGKKYYDAISPWGKAAAQGDWDKANAIWDALPKWVKDRYNAKHPERLARSVQTTQYLSYMKNWVKLFDSKDKGAAMSYFHQLPSWVKERYYKKHPGNRIQFETSAAMSFKLSQYFSADDANRASYLKANPDLQKWLAKNASKEEQQRLAILQAYRSIPPEDAWLRRVFREKYPDIFSKQAVGERRLRSVYDRLSAHPEMLPLFEQWVDAIWKSYAEMLQKGAPRPKNADIELKRRVPERKYRKSLSAAEASV